MRTKSLVFVISCLFVVGLYGSAMAYDDTTGEAFVSTVDIASVSAEVFDIQAGGAPDKIRLGVKMNAGSHLPGAIIWDIDVDNDTATGSGSVVSGIPLPPCGPGQTCKEGEGYDILIMMTLRTQGDTGNNTICDGCVGGSIRCLTRGPPCCVLPCYSITGQITCNPGDANCYILGSPCCEPDCYVMVTPCAPSLESCELPMLQGEWYASPSNSQGSNRYVRGDVFLPVTWNINNEDEICVTLPWQKIIINSYIQSGAAFDPTVPQTDPPSVQVTAMYDPAFPPPGDEEDFFTGGALDLVDYVPDVAYAFQATRNENGECDGDFDEDGDVDGSDAFKFKSSFGRSNCPECETT